MRFVLVFLLAPVFFACSQNIEEILPVDVSDDIVIPKHYVVGKTSEEITIDGLDNETSWKQVLLTEKFIDIEGVKTPKFDTQVKMLWNDRYLYVYAKLEEPHIWGDITKRDAIVFHNNDFEVFIDPSNTGFRYGEIELNALNTVWDLYLNRPYRIGAHPIFEWNLENLKTAVHIEGSLNDPTNEDSYWAVEMAIPLKPYFRMIHGSKSKINKDEQWRINFSRVQWDHDIIDGIYNRKRENGKRLDEYNWVWSNMKKIDMHQPEKWGYLQFSERADVPYQPEEDLVIKQIAYALFRNSLYGNLRELRKNLQIDTKQLDVNYGDNQSIRAQFHRTKSGFEYTLTSPTTHKSYVINNEGKLKTL